MLSVGGGITLFLVTQDNIHSSSLADLINNIAASLLSIPFVFLLYDYSNYRVSRKLNKTLSQNMTARAGTVMLGLIIEMRQIIGMRGGQITLSSINKMQGIGQREIARRTKITKAEIARLREYHSELQNIIYQYSQNNITDHATITDLSELGLDILHLINQYTFHGARAKTAKYIVNIIGRVTDWLDSDAGAAVNFQQLLAAATAGPTTTSE